MKALPFYLTLTEPLLAPALNGDPNSAVSYPFIPGSLIRGAVAHRLAQQHDDLAVQERDLLFNDRTRFLNAYPAGEDNQRALPVPLSWQREKLEDPPQKVFDLGAADETRPTQGRKLDEPFYALKDDGTVALHDPEKYFNVHTHREDRVMGRATKEDGGVFRYEAIAAGQSFVAVILFDDDKADEKLFGEQLVLGGSRSTAYGRVTLTVGETQPNWREAGGVVADIPANTPFTLTLLSDLVRQDKQGQYTTQVTKHDLAGWLGLKAEDISIQRVFKADSMVGGFNRKWGLPLTQTPALRAGSVFVLQAATAITTAVIRQLETDGIGKRRVEGFGRVSIAPVAANAMLNVYAPPEEENAPDEAQMPPPVALADTNSRTLAQTMHTRLLQSRLDNRLAVFVNQKANLAGHGITPNQLARLRTEVRGYLSGGQDNALNKLSEWLEKLRPAGRKQYEKARINGEPLLDWLKSRATEPDTVWRLLEIEPERVPLAHTDAVSEADISAGFAGQTTLRLMDGVLAKLAKEAQDNE